MIKHIKHNKMGRSNIGWLDSLHHFSFAEYYNPNNIQFGVLRVVNDDLVTSGNGFDTHPHRDMEIISYVVDGELTHADSMGNKSTLVRGQVQYMSAGTGVTHSEYNIGSELLRFLQIWILPNEKSLEPKYGEYKFKWEDRKENWMPIASGDSNGRFPIQINADVHIYAGFFNTGKAVEFTVEKGRQAYAVLIEGQCNVSGIKIEAKDALEISEEQIFFEINEPSHILVIEMEKHVF